MSPSKTTSRRTARAVRKPGRKKSAGKNPKAVKPPTIDPAHRRILEDYWSHIPPPPDEDEWMSGRI